MTASETSHQEEVCDSEQVQPRWMSNESGTIMSFKSLKENSITEVKGSIICSKCKTTRPWIIRITEHIKYEMTAFVNRSIAAPYRGTEAAWFNPDLPECQNCDEGSSMIPVIPDNENSIDWLFVFLAQMVMFCSLSQLCNYCVLNEIMIPQTKLQAIKGVYRHLLQQFLAN